MSDLILHHFDASPFAEKIRVTLGLKGLEWQSVQIPMVMPKPNLTTLTGGYRKTPVLQIGADIYCDTQRIALELERRFPAPSLFPAGCAGQALAISSWADDQLFQPGAGLSMGTNLELPEAILSDRFAFFDFLDRATLPAALPHLFAQFHANLLLVDTMLSRGHAWLLGEEVSWADAAVYASVWMCRGNIRGAEALLEGLEHVLGWEQRMLALGHGAALALGDEQALEIARAATSVAVPEIDARWQNFELHEKVTVTPQDYGAVPVTGSLVRLTAADIAVARSSDTAGEVVVHFPRRGYRVEGVGE